MKTALKIIFAALLISAAAAAVVLFLLKPQTGVNTENMLEEAKKCSSEANYSQAVIEYYKLLNVDPKNADAYIGMADVYININEKGNALNILDKGYNETKDERIREKLDFLSSSSVDTDVVPAEPIAEDALPEEAAAAVVTSVTSAVEETEAAPETEEAQETEVSETDEAAVETTVSEEELIPEETTLATEIVTEEASLPETTLAVAETTISEETSIVTESETVTQEEPSEKLITIPDLTAMTYEEAAAFAEENKLELLRKEVSGSDDENGTITYQFIPAGFAVPEHTTVVVVVSVS